jgi:hypothetical protein
MRGKLRRLGHRKLRVVDHVYKREKDSASSNAVLVTIQRKKRSKYDIEGEIIFPSCDPESLHNEGGAETTVVGTSPSIMCSGRVWYGNAARANAYGGEGFFISP